MSQQALDVGAQRRREVVLGSMRAARAEDGSMRHAIGAALMSFGGWIYGERAAVSKPAARRMQTSA
jgi:hypothetical protein